MYATMYYFIVGIAVNLIMTFCLQALTSAQCLAASLGDVASISALVAHHTPLAKPTSISPSPSVHYRSCPHPLEVAVGMS